jgi:hypothetical protein
MDAVCVFTCDIHWHSDTKINAVVDRRHRTWNHTKNRACAGVQTPNAARTGDTTFAT